MTYSKKARFADVKIDKFSNKGNGCGQFSRVDGSTSDAEVAFTIPGDYVHAELFSKKRGKWQGQMERVIEPSSDRIDPKCKHFGVCGGCRWQQMSYSTQLKYKEALVRDLFAPYLLSDTIFYPIEGSALEWNYRNKMEFSFSSDLNRNKYLGLIKNSSKGRVLNLTECHLVNPWFMDTVQTVRDWWEASQLEAYHMHKNTGSLRTLILREGMKTGDRLVMLTVSGNPDYALQRHHLESFVSTLHQVAEPKTLNSKLNIFLRIQQVAQGMTTNFYEMLLYGSDYIEEHLEILMSPEETPVRFRFKISPSAFFQPNVSSAERFYSLAIQLSGINDQTVIYDLFCGTGTLGICASKKAKQVIGIELSPEAALDARQNAILNKCDNVTILSGAVRHVLSQISEEKKLPAPDVVFIDPPRSGLDPNALQQVIDLNPKKILFISCNPSTQAANISELIKAGYKIKAIQPFDQFPQTFHIENVVLLEQNK
ncbi:MAG: 23S rRNA (uracil-5-)-methyltransferase RumA [Chlamydiales bacterium 38-26]|nr:23S rRNA (uracil(1939)-C(5))-methyltransferase RlmD [Chlamydiales bacterium]OJV11404.1 MAG: 23S rRNA (uracil-5-)-methyltransferase RumA [Chlamydiales bacterium 38-26]